ncbi:hypothetical protein [Aliisedimentitalea sp. MJ-SS2]|uniref:hypothetical protein n=1 Tax=Aliisedimentitalea sp. MJ-SS2 TaxID=3049795 RepID=UPI0029312A08|nr:hypothetical protein [Alisedimentitalea sp. MJ-SS2]
MRDADPDCRLGRPHRERSLDQILQIETLALKTASWLEVFLSGAFRTMGQIGQYAELPDRF